MPGFSIGATGYLFGAKQLLLIVLVLGGLYSYTVLFSRELCMCVIYDR